jgi:NAD(P)-dependent dehydrogenase (short-subunit alcohol dehydrogenase family)
MGNERVLEGQFALITGGSRGIGRAIAASLAAAGCNVAVASRSREGSEAAASEIGRLSGVRTIGIRADVSRQESVEALFRELRAWSMDRLDVLVNNAGYPFKPEIWNTPLHATPAGKLRAWYLDAFETDAMGSVYCTFEALSLMMARRYGSLIFISSTPALQGSQGSPYTLAKAAILGLMKDVALQYGEFNIRSNALALGSIRTPATYDNLDPDLREAIVRETPLQRWGKPEEIGDAAVFLASENSSFITGQTLVVDGGILRR